MKILCLCNEGNNRSVTLAHLLRYWNNDVLSAWIDKNPIDTMTMLIDWADLVILTDMDQVYKYNGDLTEEELKEKSCLCNIWPDIYKRPFNPELLAIVKEWLQENKETLKN